MGERQDGRRVERHRLLHIKEIRCKGTLDSTGNIVSIL